MASEENRKVPPPPLKKRRKSKTSYCSVRRVHYCCCCYSYCCCNYSNIFPQPLMHYVRTLRCTVGTIYRYSYDPDIPCMHRTERTVPYVRGIW